jgi:hypothetical protein
MMTPELTPDRPRRRAPFPRIRARRLQGFAALLAALAVPLGWPQADASFTASTADSGNTWSAAATFVNQLLGNPGFETGTAAPWTVTSAAEINNSIQEPPRSGQWDAWLAPVAGSPEVLSQTVSLPAGLKTATLSFWLHTDFHGSLGAGTMTVQLLNSGGTVLTTLATFAINNTSGYTQYSYNVLAYAGQTVVVKFNATATLLRQPNFVIDDTALSVG